MNMRSSKIVLILLSSAFVLVSVHAMPPREDVDDLNDIVFDPPADIEKGLGDSDELAKEKKEEEDELNAARDFFFLNKESDKDAEEIDKAVEEGDVGVEDREGDSESEEEIKDVSIEPIDSSGDKDIDVDEEKDIDAEEEKDIDVGEEKDIDAEEDKDVDIEEDEEILGKKDDDSSEEEVKIPWHQKVRKYFVKLGSGLKKWG